MKVYRDRFATHSQIRVGKGAKAIVITKLRTMKHRAHADFEKSGRFLAELKTDERVTATGRVLRKLKLDELPQILSWLRGDLRLIGMRPITRQSFRALPEKYKKMYAEVGPGLMGIQYAVPSRQRTNDNILKLFDEFYSDLKKSKRRTYFRWGRRILLNLHR